MSWERTLGRLGEIRSDRTRGARELALEASHAVRVAAREAARDRRARDLEQLARAVVDAQPEMAPFYHLAAVILANREHPESLEDGMAEFIRKLETESAAVRAAQQVPAAGTVITYSRSGSVLSALQVAHRSGREFRVLLGEGRPGYEGRTVAADLQKAGIAVALLTDAALLSRVDEADLILLGVDAVGRQKFRNKVGTRALCTVARAVGRVTYVVMDETKLLPEEYWRVVAERSPSEVWADAPTGVAVGNPYFEAVAVGEVDGFIDGERVMTAEGIAEAVERTAARLEPLLRLLD